jgi:hypothetical protein
MIQLTVMLSATHLALLETTRNALFKCYATKEQAFQALQDKV